MAKIEFDAIGKMLKAGLQETENTAIPIIMNEQLVDISKAGLVPISPKKADGGTGKSRGTLRNSGIVGKAINNVGILSWDTVYARKMYNSEKNKINYSEPTAKSEWALFNWEINKNKYSQMYTKIFNKNKLK